MATFNELFSDIGQGVEDMARAGIADVQNHYQQFLTGRPAPMTTLIGDMQYTTEPSSAPEPQSFGAALREHYGMEQADIRTRQEAEQASNVPAPEPASTGPEPEV